MVRHRSLRAALVAVAAVVVAVGPAAGPAVADDPDLIRPQAAAQSLTADRPAVASRLGARRAAKAPLAVTIDTLTPSSIPARGPVQVAGTVTNTDAVPWLTVNAYSFISAEPMTTGAQLAAAAQVEESLTVGERITREGTFFTIGAIPPRET